MRVVAGAVLHSRYRFLRALGSGAMGTAWLAHDSVRDTEVALKILRAGSPALLEAFRAEFATLRGLIHPRLVRVRDYGVVIDDAAPVHYYASDVVLGSTLDAFAAGRRYENVRDAIVDAARALHFLHRCGIRHGDVKPANVLVDENGRGTLIDLGCSARLDRAPASRVAGTPHFLAPELLAGLPVDERADLYSLGVMLRSLGEALEGGLPAPVAALAAKLASRAPDDRPSGVGEVLEWLGVPDEEIAPVRIHAPHLLGRREQVSRFERALESLLAREPGERTLVFVGGSGVGVTRLLEEIKWIAQLRGAVVDVGPPRPTVLHRALERAVVPSVIAHGLPGVLAARAMLVERGEPLVVLADDVDRWPDVEREQLAALVRSIEADDPILLVAGTHDTTGQLPPPAIPVEPLAASDVATWVSDLVPPSQLVDVLRLTGGYPAAIEVLLARRASAPSGTLATLTGPSGVRDTIASTLTGQESRAHALVALLDGEMSDALARGLDVSVESVAALVRRGFLVATEAGYKLARVADAFDIAAALGADERRALHLAIVDALASPLAEEDEASRASRVARRASHASRGGRDDLALTLLRDHTALVPLASHAFLSAAESIAMHDPESLLLRATIQHAAARVDRALGSIARIMAARPSPALRAQAKTLAAACYVRRGNAPAAIRQCRGVLALDGSDARRLQMAPLAARANSLLGNHARALEIAESALAIEPMTESQRAELDEAYGTAASYLGDFASARRHLARAALVREQVGEPRARVRSASYSALNEYRAGDARAAAKGYRSALDLAEMHGMGDQVATAALNLGTACHQLGEWGEAIASYERGLRMAIAVGQKSTETTLRFNIAKLFIDVGLFDRAERAIPVARAIAADAGRSFLVAAIDALEGELHLVRRDPSRAAPCFERARQRFVEARSTLEILEVDIHLGEVALAESRVAAALDRAIALRDPVQALGAEDLLARRELLEGRCALLQGKPALAVLEAALRRASAIGQRALEAEILAELATAYEREGANNLAEEHRGRARVAWERIAATLAPVQREAFHRHPKRAALRRVPSVHDVVSRHEGRERDLRRLIELNKKLSSLLHGAEVLEHAMDAAIELAGAERGFLILAPTADGELRVAVARNLDREKIGRSHLKFSRGIAEQVLAEGEPVFTVDARTDERFEAHVSIHAMRLKSVVCLPIRSPSGVVGALYLDNRFRETRMSELDTDILLAFADQVAIALENARLHEELEQRTKELEAERRRVDQLLSSQAAQIDRLSEAVRIRQTALERRHDYGQIIGRAPAMQAVFEVLDRVIDTDITVLVQGESGTGKELIARAIHFNGRRKDAPFAAINCGAVPSSLLESELFGHLRGAFTGADRDRPGLFVEANTGTVFLDELGEMPLDMQVKLLRVLQEREVRAVGASAPRSIDVRVVCATNRNLREEVAAGRFRSDLYYRIGVVELTLPPLRERREDIPELVAKLLETAASQLGRPPPKLTRSAMNALLGHPWPGNVRELENVLMKTALLFAGEEVSGPDLRLAEVQSTRAEDRRERNTFEREEKAQIAAALRTHRWKVAEVARTLGIPRATLYRKLERYGLRRRDD